MARHFKLVLILFLLQFSLKAQHGKLFLLAGQRNAVGTGDSLKSVVCLPNRSFEFDASANQFIPLKDPVGKACKLFQKAGTGSIAPAFEKRLILTLFSVGLRGKSPTQEIILSGQDTTGHHCH